MTPIVRLNLGAAMGFLLVTACSGSGTKSTTSSSGGASAGGALSSGVASGSGGSTSSGGRGGSAPSGGNTSANGGDTASIGGASGANDNAGGVSTSSGGQASGGSASVGGDGGTSGASGAAPGGGGSGGMSGAGAGSGGVGGAGGGPTNPSCNGLAATCGPNGNGNCCASSVVTGVTSATFYRSYDGVTYTNNAYPAEVSDFRLDTYEITVGRFRKFVAAYSQTMIASGAGANPNNASDTGWSATSTANLDANASALTTALKCNATYQTWTDTQGSPAAESLPINCLDWFEAEAFCIWDGGRLPTEAEWNYAASGGVQQRVYPWGSAAPDCTYANYEGAAGGTDYCTQAGTGGVNRVGSESPKGDGLYGQADLAGNVFEWAQDWYVSPYTNPCDNCAYLADGALRVIRGGFYTDPAWVLFSSFRSSNSPVGHLYSIGARCARAR